MSDRGPGVLGALVGAGPLAALLATAVDRIGAVVAAVPRPSQIGPLVVAGVLVLAGVIYRRGGARAAFVFGLSGVVYWWLLEKFVVPGPPWQGTLAPRALLSADPAALATLLALARVLATGAAALAMAALPFVWTATAGDGDGDATATATTRRGDSTDG